MDYSRIDLPLKKKVLKKSNAIFDSAKGFKLLLRGGEGGVNLNIPSGLISHEALVFFFRLKKSAHL